jgi:hypothetical protein
MWWLWRCWQVVELWRRCARRAANIEHVQELPPVLFRLRRDAMIQQVHELLSPMFNFLEVKASSRDFHGSCSRIPVH